MPSPDDGHVMIKRAKYSLPPRPASELDRTELDRAVVGIHVRWIKANCSAIRPGLKRGLAEIPARLIGQILRDHPLMQHPFRPRRLSRPAMTRNHRLARVLPCDLPRSPQTLRPRRR